MSTRFSLICIICTLVSSSPSLAAPDPEILTPCANGKEVVGKVNAELNKIFPNDHGFMDGIACTESKYGTDFNTFNTGKGGIYQVDEDSAFKATKDVASHPSLATKHQLIQTTFGIVWRDVSYIELKKPLHSGIAARMYLSLDPNPIPEDKTEQAQLWKDYYNTAAGAGTVDKFLNCSTTDNQYLKGNTGVCNFYSKCLKDKFPTCGYPDYGGKYCNRLRQSPSSSCFNLNGRSWAISATNCLNIAIANGCSSCTSCMELTDSAYSRHPSCYFDSGSFCSSILLSRSNIFCLASKLDTTSILDRRGIQQIYKTATMCLKEQADSFLSQVDDWISNAGPTTVTKRLLQELKNLLGGCSAAVDIMFILDSSGSISGSNYITMKNFVADVISNFDIGSDKTHVGVIRYSNTASIVIPLGSINNATQLVTAVNSISYIGLGTNTHLALDLLLSAFSINSRVNEGIPRIAVIFTDGRSNSAAETVKSAQRVHNEHNEISVFSFGIGANINITELQIIASDSNNVIRIDNFSPGQFAAKLKQLQTSACTTPSERDVGDELKDTIRINEVRRLEFHFDPDQGMTLNVAVEAGDVLIRGSFTISDPSSLTQDFSVNSTGSSNINYFISQELYQASTSTGENMRRKRQISANATSEENVYLSIIGLIDGNNTFTFNTTFGCDLPCGCPLGPTCSTESSAFGVYCVTTFQLILTFVMVLVTSYMLT